ncbi:MAG: nucleoside hydrolase [Aggregatilineales bacterium]
MSMRKKVLLDTDIGSDIDDVVSLAYLLVQPDCELVGITTVTGQAIGRARIASALCYAAGKPDIPIYPGSESPLLITQRQTKAPQTKALSQWEHQRHFEKGTAVEFMRRTIRENPGEITLLAVGPLTNIALLFAVDNEIPLLLRELVLMCGAFTDYFRFAEWNAKLDPHATHMVYNAPVTRHQSIGLDVTTKVQMPSAAVRDQFQSNPVLDAVLSFAEVYFQEHDTMIFHDPLAAASLFDDELCNFRRGDVRVEVNDAEKRGKMYWQPDTYGVHEVAMYVNPERFFQHFFAQFKT